MKLAAAALAALLLLLCPRVAGAFCGFYVSGADGKLLAEATQVVLMREGTRTVLAMQNDYKGPPEDFALVVPVPVVLQKENVKTLAKDVFERVDLLGAPRLVEYWEQDPCPKPGIGLGNIGTIGRGSGIGQGFGFGSGRLGGAHVVVIEAQFEVGEYEILILSAQDSSGLDAWLRERGYKIPANAEPALRPYVQAGSKFFVAKVNVAKVKFEDGRASLSPLRFHYDSESFVLPVRLGLLNSAGAQDLVVNVIAAQRHVVANYPNVTIPTNFDVSDATRARFGEFYAALFDATLAKSSRAVVTEYAWNVGSCDPCPGKVPGGLSASDLVTLGGDVLPSTQPAGTSTGGVPVVRQTGAPTVKGKLDPAIVTRIVRQNFGRFRFCYEKALQSNPALQGGVSLQFDIDDEGNVSKAADSGSDLADRATVACFVSAVRNLKFPPPGATTAAFGFALSTQGGTASARAFSPAARGFTLTRLHLRYGADALGEDLVFKAAEPVVGGREIRAADGTLEHGTTPSPTNAFQARYVIRHAWPGPIECEHPQRGVWGGPWPDAGAPPSAEAPQPATKLAYAPRSGSAILASFIPTGAADLVPGPALTGDAASPDIPDAAPDAGPPVPATRSRCGCHVAGDPSARHGACALAALSLLSRRRRRRP